MPFPLVSKRSLSPIAESATLRSSHTPSLPASQTGDDAIEEADYTLHPYETRYLHGSDDSVSPQQIPVASRPPDIKTTRRLTPPTLSFRSLTRPSGADTRATPDSLALPSPSRASSAGPLPPLRPLATRKPVPASPVALQFRHDDQYFSNPAFGATKQRGLEETKQPKSMMVDWGEGRGTVHGYSEVGPSALRLTEPASIGGSFDGVSSDRATRHDSGVDGRRVIAQGGRVMLESFPRQDKVEAEFLSPHKEMAQDQFDSAPASTLTTSDTRPYPAQASVHQQAISKAHYSGGITRCLSMGEPRDASPVVAAIRRGSARTPTLHRRLLQEPQELFPYIRYSQRRFELQGSLGLGTRNGSEVARNQEAERGEPLVKSSGPTLHTTASRGEVWRDMPRWIPVKDGSEEDEGGPESQMTRSSDPQSIYSVHTVTDDTAATRGWKEEHPSQRSTVARQSTGQSILPASPNATVGNRLPTEDSPPLRPLTPRPARMPAKPISSGYALEANASSSSIRKSYYSSASRPTTISVAVTDPEGTVDAGTQTSPHSAISSNRPLPQPPVFPPRRGETHTLSPEGIPAHPGMPPYQDGDHREKTSTLHHDHHLRTPTSPLKKPSPPKPSEPPEQATASRFTNTLPPNASLPSSDLPTLIASHLLSTHAAAMMQHSAAVRDISEAMAQIAKESLDWGGVLLSMSQVRRPAVPLKAARPTSLDWTIPPPFSRSHPAAKSDHHTEPPPAHSPRVSGLPDPVRAAWEKLHGASLGSDLDNPFAPVAATSQASRHPFAHPHNQHAVRRDRPMPTALRPMSSLNSPLNRAAMEEERRRRLETRHASLPVYWVSEAERLGEEGWENLRKSQEAWKGAMDSLKSLVERSNLTPEETVPTQNESAVSRQGLHWEVRSSNLFVPRASSPGIPSHRHPGTDYIWRPSSAYTGDMEQTLGFPTVDPGEAVRDLGADLRTDRFGPALAGHEVLENEYSARGSLPVHRDPFRPLSTEVRSSALVPSAKRTLSDGRRKLSKKTRRRQVSRRVSTPISTACVPSPLDLGPGYTGADEEEEEDGISKAGEVREKKRHWWFRHGK